MNRHPLYCREQILAFVSHNSSSDSLTRFHNVIAIQIISNSILKTEDRWSRQEGSDPEKQARITDIFSREEGGGHVPPSRCNKAESMFLDNSFVLLQVGT